MGKLLLTYREEYQKKQGYFTNMVESVIVEDWKFYEQENLKEFDDDAKLEIFKKVFLEDAPVKNTRPNLNKK